MSEDNSEFRRLSLVTTADLYDSDVVILEDGTVAWVGTALHSPTGVIYDGHPGSGPGYSLQSYGTSLRSFVLEGVFLLLSEASADSLQSSVLATVDDEVQKFIKRSGLPAGGFVTEWFEGVRELAELSLDDVYCPLDDGLIYRVSDGRFRVLNHDAQNAPEYHGVVVGEYLSTRANPEWPVLTIRPRETPRSTYSTGSSS